MHLSTDQLALVRLIAGTAAANALPSLLLVGLGYLENRKFDSNDESGDSGQAFGLFQQNIRVWGIPAHRWHGVEGTEASMRVMMGRWTDAYRTVAAGYDFETDPAGFLMAWFRPAQGGSAVLTPKQCQDAIDRARAALSEAGQGAGMVAKPPVIFIPAHADNINVRPAGVLYECLVVHTSQGGSDIPTLGRWFGGENIRQGMNGSTHFGAAPDGTLGQFVSLDQMPIAHGQEAGATAKLARDNQGLSANAWAIGCETLDGGMPGTCTPAQLEAIARLFAWLWQSEIAPHAATTGAVLDRDHVIGHYELAPASRARCPSWPETRFQALIARVGALLAGPVPVPDPRDEKITQLKAALAITIDAVDAVALSASNSAKRLRDAATGARDALARWG